MPVNVERSATVAAPPAKVFAHLHDPDARPFWDPAVDLARVEGDRAGVGARLHLRGRRKAPSWVGEYTVWEPPHASSLTLLEGLGMPFRSLVQSIAIARSPVGSEVTLRTVYEPARGWRLIEPFTIRRNVVRTTARAIENVRDHFAP